MEYFVILDEEDSSLMKSLGFTHQSSVQTELAEILYTARGSQGFATFGWIDDVYSVWALYDQPERIETVQRELKPSRENESVLTELKYSKEN